MSTNRTAPTWRHRLQSECASEVEADIDAFEAQVQARQRGELDERLFMEARLRRGVYGQRYDNGQRHDGTESRALHFPSGELTKGPHTLWDAPGMQRIKVPYGRLTAAQMEALADVAEEYSDAILHVTTRQDIQLHFVHIEDTPDMMRRLAAVGITTLEACGNSVRNVTACPYAGVCRGEAFDVSPYADALTQFLLGHPDVQDFGRKFKIALSGCATEPCGLVKFHDLGAIAVVRDEGGAPRRGFDVYVGGGLGAVPSDAKLLAAFVPEEELLPVSQAVARVFARLGEKKNRARARLKFLVRKLGIDEFRRLVEAERAELRPDPRWTAFLDRLDVGVDGPRSQPEPAPAAPTLSAPTLSAPTLSAPTLSAPTLSAPTLSAPTLSAPTDPELARFVATNVRAQRQPGYSVVTVALPLGDLTSTQLRGLADLARELVGDTLRTTVEQNVVFRWVPNALVPALHDRLRSLGLGAAGAETISDVTSCPGTDTCKLGISSSRGLAGELRKRLTVVQDSLDPAAQALRIKASGCFNSCSQHHVADLGFLGVARNVQGRRVPHFQLVLGGEWKNNAGSFGLALGAIPSKNVPRAVERLVAAFTAERHADESFRAYVARKGKAAIRDSLEDLAEVPDYATDPSFYSDHGDPREYTIGDIGVGECAGEVVPAIEFGIEAAERALRRAQDALDESGPVACATFAYEAMTTAAKSLLRHLDVQVRDEDDDVELCFRRYLDETRLFHDPFAGGKFAHYYRRVHAKRPFASVDADEARQIVEEAQLFLEATHAAYARVTEGNAAARTLVREKQRELVGADLDASRGEPAATDDEAPRAARRSA